jgi:TRAP-type C4-dicarboxylate transport system substrate-binding protein
VSERTIATDRSKWEVSMKALAFKCFAAAGILASAGTFSGALAQETLKFAMPGAPYDVHYHEALVPWAEAVAADSEGTIEIEFYVGPRLAHFGNLTQRLIDGVADIGFGIHGPSGEPFPKTEVVTLPFITSNPAESGPALWDLYEQGVISDEYDRWKVLALFTFPPQQIHTTEPVESPDGLSGKKLTVGDRVTGQIFELLGGSPVSMAPPEVYQAISRGTVSGAVMPWTGTVDFKLYEVAKNHLVTGLGFPPAYVMMNKEKYDSLPDAAKAAIDKHSYGVFSDKLGAVLKSHGENSRKKIEDQGDQKFVELSDAERSALEERVQSVIDAWIANTPDGQAVYDAYKEAIEQIRAGG